MKYESKILQIHDISYYNHIPSKETKHFEQLITNRCF